MLQQHIAILYPGAMGISLAATAQRTGQRVSYPAEGRSIATQSRAATHGLAAASLAELCATCTVMVSICPPHAAEQVAQQVIAGGFKGLYLDANAIAPQRSIQIGQMMGSAGIAFVDGGIIGGPAWQPQRTWLYLSGPQAAAIAACFTAGPLETQILDAAIGTASALKMCYAAYSKGTTALLCAILASAERMGIRSALAQQWARDDSAFPAQVDLRVREVTAKAWRFAGEMEEIAHTLQAAGVPGEFHQSAATIYRRLAQFKDARELPELDAVLSALLAAQPEPSATDDHVREHA